MNEYNSYDYDSVNFMLAVTRKMMYAKGEIEKGLKNPKFRNPNLARAVRDYLIPAYTSSIPDNLRKNDGIDLADLVRNCDLMLWLAS